MKIKYFLPAFALALMFAACSNEETNNENGSDNGVVTDPTGTAWVSLKVNSPVSAFNTRALNDPNVMTGTEAETEISSFLAIFFDKDKKLTLAKTINSTDNEFGNPSQPQGDAGDAFQVPVASKRILIVANPSASFKSQVTSASVGTSTYDNINALLTDNANGDILKEISTDNNFMMSNAKGGLEPSNEDGTDKDLVLYNQKTAAEASPVSINIDRVVAKVRLFAVAGSGSSAIESEYANIYNPGWALSVTNKKFFPVSARVKTFMESGTANSVGTGVPRATCITPFDQYYLGSYRVDPNHGTTQPSLGSATDFSDASWTAYKEHYHVLPEIPASSFVWNAINTSQWGTPQEYCLENTQTDVQNQWGYTTQVIFKAEFAPKGLRIPVYNDAVVPGGLYNGTGVSGGAVTSGTDWIMISEAYGYNGFYTYDLLMLWLEAELTYKYRYDAANQTPSGINNMTLFNAWNAYLNDIGAIPALITIANGNYDPTFSNVATDVATAMNLINTSAIKNSVIAKGSHRYGQVSYYTGGISYYPIMIKHDDDTILGNLVLNEFGEFGVVRNSVYDINITKVNKPGYPTIPLPDTTPDEDDQNFLSIKINVNPWTWYKQDVPL